MNHWVFIGWMCYLKTQSANSLDSKEEMKQISDSDGSKAETAKMVLACKSCSISFDSTFTVDEFSLVSEQQFESGTLHICPHCGNLSIYLMKDYREPR